mgnify:CR=1 FL=1
MALLVSGGHTQIVKVTDYLNFEVIGHTIDDAVGEAFDKCAKMMGLGYPGGPIVDKLSKLGNDTYELPMPLDDDSYNFSFSGLKSAVINLSHNEEQRGQEINKSDLACSFQNVVIDSLTKKTLCKYNGY